MGGQSLCGVGGGVVITGQHTASKGAGKGILTEQSWKEAGKAGAPTSVQAALGSIGGSNSRCRILGHQREQLCLGIRKKKSWPQTRDEGKKRARECRSPLIGA